MISTDAKPNRPIYFEASFSQAELILTAVQSWAISVFLILHVFTQPQIASAQIPSSQRSKKAIQKVKPELEKALHAQSLKFGSPIFIRIFKASKELEIWVQAQKTYRQFRTYKICYFSGEPGPKLKRGDNQSPEGFYFVKPNQLNPWSQFHLSFNIGYPNTYDRFHKRTGSAIMIHGSCVSVGCYAMTDEKVEEIYTLADAALRNGQRFFRVHIFPFRMTKENIKAHQRSKWIGFWQNLKVGYDYFEKNKRPPNVVVRSGQYVFEDDFRRVDK
jgi:murein L,D-transpeptidase YafK